MCYVEFYSAYIYSHDESENGRTVSIAEYVDGNKKKKLNFSLTHFFIITMMLLVYITVTNVLYP